MSGSRARLTDRLRRRTTSGNFIPQIDGLRFVAIAMVVLFHLNGYFAAKATRAFSAPASHDLLYRTLFVGDRGVKVFFVVSGFILALPFAAHHLLGRQAP